MAKWQLVMDFVPIATAGARLRQVSGVFEIPDQLGGSSFSHTDGLCDVSQARTRVGGDTRQHMRVVGDEVPNMILIVGNTSHE
jgi:hypothetical protein